MRFKDQIILAYIYFRNFFPAIILAIFGLIAVITIPYLRSSPEDNRCGDNLEQVETELLRTMQRMGTFGGTQSQPLSETCSAYRDFLNLAANSYPYLKRCGHSDKVGGFSSEFFTLRIKKASEFINNNCR
ncbi:hypothetical protein WJT86_09735 [Microvirga sp. W0021]|uniref:Uncharacterized protein n=1 Tax=Hohaiivirga grylli TaxID=3133970 RepID=A0ABV0BKW1_9HYPH